MYLEQIMNRNLTCPSKTHESVDFKIRKLLHSDYLSPSCVLLKRRPNYQSNMAGKGSLIRLFEILFFAGICHGLEKISGLPRATESLSGVNRVSVIITLDHANDRRHIGSGCDEVVRLRPSVRLTYERPI
jgi:hypothetical protein